MLHGDSVYVYTHACKCNATGLQNIFPVGIALFAHVHALYCAKRKESTVTFREAAEIRKATCIATQQ